VEAGARFVTAAGFHSNSWDTHSKNDEGTRPAVPAARPHALGSDRRSDERGLLATTVCCHG